MVLYVMNVLKEMTVFNLFSQPTLIQGPNILSTGEDFVSEGPLISAIA